MTLSVHVHVVYWGMIAGEGGALVAFVCHWGYMFVQECSPAPTHEAGKAFHGNRECTMLFDCATGIPFDDHETIDK